MPPKPHSLAALALLASVAAEPSIIGERTVGKDTKKEINKTYSAAKRKRIKKDKMAKLSRKRNRR